MTVLPLPEPPADAVAELLDELRTVRRELIDAGRLVHMLGVDFPGDTPLAGLLRLRIEQAVAERRCELWAAEQDRIITRGRALGLDVVATL